MFNNFFVIQLCFLQYCPETEGHEAVACSLVELGLELDPVQAEGVEEGGQSLHQHHHSDGGPRPEGEHEVEHGHADVGFRESHPEHHGPEHVAELVVGEGERPQAEVAGGVGDGAKHVLDGVDSLDDQNVSKALFLMLVTGAVCSDTVFIFGLVVNSSIVLSPFSPVEPNGQWFPEEHYRYHHDSDDNKSHLNVVLVRKHVHIVVHRGVCSVV